jgi:hypothetical protein
MSKNKDEILGCSMFDQKYPYIKKGLFSLSEIETLLGHAEKCEEHMKYVSELKSLLSKAVENE